MVKATALALALAMTAVSCAGTGSAGSARGGSASDAAVRTILSSELVDVRSGERFSLGGFAGKTTLFIAMAVW